MVTQGTNELTMAEHSRADRFVDVASVFLISIAAVLTALSGYQSGRWSGEQAQFYNRANASRIESAEASGKANALTAIDIVTFLNYLNALAAHDTVKINFLSTRFRPEMRPALDAWLASRPFKNPHAPSSPFVMPQYALQSRAEAEKAAKAADTEFRAAVEANRNSDNFLLLTVIFSGVSFLAGISTRMVYPRHAAVVCLGTLALIYGLIRLIGLPFL
jgi:hypothetical protein